jgi:Flp pilus assembly protein TadD
MSVLRTYMVVDPRHDHGFRVPRPDLSERLGIANACNDCHGDKPPQWAAAAIEQWHGPNRKGFQNYAEAFHAAWTDQAGAAALLAAVAADRNAPAFARAGALSELAARGAPANVAAARAALADPDPMMRIAGLDLIEQVPPVQLWPLASPLLSDPSRGVRIRAAAVLAALPNVSVPARRARTLRARRGRIRRGAAVQRRSAGGARGAGKLLRATRPRRRGGSRVPGRAAAERVLRARDVNLADLYRQLGRDGEAESALRAAIATSPQDAGLHHALGLTLVRMKRSGEALDELHRAVDIEPGRARYAYVYAVALHSAGRRSDAMAVLTDSLKQHPDDRDTVEALVAFNRVAGNVAAALQYAEQLGRIAPADRKVARLIEELRSQASKAGGQ